MYDNPEFLQERYELSIEKIRQIAAEGCGFGHIRECFTKTAGFICIADAYYRFVKQEGLQNVDPQVLKAWNEKLNADILPENYGCSYCNPAYAAEKLGEQYGRLLSALAAEIRGMAAAEGLLEEFLIRMELFVEICSAFEYEWQESGSLPEYESIRQIFYWYVSDYSDLFQEMEILRAVKSDRVMELNKSDCLGKKPDKQYKHDHKEDMALFWDKALMQRKLEVLKTTLEKCGESAKNYAEAAIREIDIEEAFEASDRAVSEKPQAARYSAKQLELIAEYKELVTKILQEYLDS